MIDQEEIHNQCLSEDPEERVKALEQLKDNFPLLSDKRQTWNNLHKLTNDEDSSIRYKAASVLGSVFYDVLDKQQAWNDLIKLTNDEDSDVRYKAASVLGSVYSDVPDKRRAWNDLHKLINDESWDVRYKAASVLGSVYSEVPDKQQAWNDLIKLNTDKYSSVRYEAFSFLDSLYSGVPDKQQVWSDLIKLNAEKNSSVMFKTVSALGSVFSHVPDKQQAWNDLIKLTNDEDNSVRSIATSVLGPIFYGVPDKQQAWNDLIKLTNDEDSSVRYKITSILGSVFYGVPDKQQAWNDLIKLTNGENWDVRHKAASALGSVFSHVPDKQQAWNDLHKLITDKKSDVKYKAASALGSVFYGVPDKQQVWNDLHKLTTDENSDVRTYANHSLGKVSIFKASQSGKEEEYKKELKTAIMFFEKAAKESWLNNPSQFCLPFYRSFYTIIFQNQEEAKEEVSKYLAEAKDAVRGSKSKELLFEAVKNLANALKEVQNLENLDLETKKSELNFYRQYCDRAAELMIETEETAPFATIAMRKGLPILDRNLKELLEEIQKKAKIACKESKGTDTEEVACTINSEIQRWEIGSQEEMTFNLENLIFTLEANTPRNLQSDFIIDRIKQIPDQKDVAKQYGMLNSIITLIIKSSSEQKLQEIGEKVDQISDKLEEITISLKPGISEELIIHVGPITQWGGIEYTMTIPLQDISYPELKEDLQKIVGKKIDKLSKMPSGLANKVRDYLVQKKMWSILDKLT